MFFSAYYFIKLACCCYIGTSSTLIAGASYLMNTEMWFRSKNQ